jgi:hypothetical protein
MDLGLSYGVPYLPVTWQPRLASGWGRQLTRLGGAFLLGYLATFVVKRETARAVSAGAVTVVGYDIAKLLLNPILPAGHQLSAYDYGGYYPFLTGFGRTSSGGTTDGMSSYLPGGGMSSYLPSRSAAPQTVSAFLEPDTPSGSYMGADIEL